MTTTTSRTFPWQRSLVWLVVVGVAVALPQFLSSTYVDRLSSTFYMAIAALGVSLLTGFNGQISLGHGAFLGVGAYVTLILTVDYGFSYFAAGVVAVAFAFVVGILIGLPALRITGVYLALVTLALATLFPPLVTKVGELTGGNVGRTLIPREGFGDWETLQEVGRRPFLRESGFRAPDWTGLADDQWRYYIFLGLVIITFVLVHNLVHSRVGRALVAIRDNETAASVTGINVSLFKVLTFGVSAGFAAVGGWMYAVLNNSVSPTAFTLVLSITILVASILGGANSVLGALIGSLLITGVRESVPAESQRFTQVVFGGVLIVIMLVAPGGIVGIYRRIEARVRRRKATKLAAAQAAAEATTSGGMT